MLEAKQDIRRTWRDYARKRSESLRNELMEYYLPLVKKIARQVHARLPREVELGDLESAGIFGLMDAIEGFDPGRNVKFETYCSVRIRGAILDELRAWDWVPRVTRLRAHRLRRAVRQLSLELGRKPTHQELARRLDLSSSELEKLLREVRPVRMMRLWSRCLPWDQEEDKGDGDFLEDRRAIGRQQMVEREDMKEAITRGLTRAEKLILILYYFEEMSMREIGVTLDLSESRVSQMHATIVNRLQERWWEWSRRAALGG